MYLIPKCGSLVTLKNSIKSKLNYNKLKTDAPASFLQVRPRQRPRQRQRGHLLRALPALHPPHCGHGQAPHPQSFFILLNFLSDRTHKQWPGKPLAAHATALGRVPRLRRLPGVLLWRRHHAVPLWEAGGLFWNHVSSVRAHGKRQNSTGGVHHRQEAGFLREEGVWRLQDEFNIRATWTGQADWSASLCQMRRRRFGIKCWFGGGGPESLALFRKHVTLQYRGLQRMEHDVMSDESSLLPKSLTIVWAWIYIIRCDQLWNRQRFLCSYL